MRYPETDEDFDDGGTPEWRRRHEQPGVRRWWRQARPAHVFVVGLAAAILLPSAVFVLGLLVAFAWSEITGS